MGNKLRRTFISIWKRNQTHVYEYTNLTFAIIHSIPSYVTYLLPPLLYYTIMQQTNKRTNTGRLHSKPPSIPPRRPQTLHDNPRPGRGHAHGRSPHSGRQRAHGPARRLRLLLPGRPERTRPLQDQDAPREGGPGCHGRAIHRQTRCHSELWELLHGHPEPLHARRTSGRQKRRSPLRFQV